MFSKIFHGVVRAVFSGLLGIACALVLLPALAAFHFDGSDTAASMGYAVVAIVTILGVFAPTLRRALGRGFLLLGFSFFALPISTLLLSGRVAHDMTSASADPAAAAIGAGLAGAMLTGLGGIFGGVFGVIFMVLGLVLVLGGRREVVVVNMPKDSGGRGSDPPLSG